MLTLKAHLIPLLFNGSLPPPKALSCGFFAGARPRFGRNGWCRGLARVGHHALARSPDVGTYDVYLRNLRAFRSLSAIGRDASRLAQEQCIIVFP